MNQKCRNDQGAQQFVDQYIQAMTSCTQPMIGMDVAMALF